MMSCSESKGPVQSAESDNSKRITVKGTAATGYAASFSKVTLTDADQDTLAIGRTDSTGQFTLPVEMEGLNFPFLVEVNTDDKGSLTALVLHQDEAVEEGEEFFTLVNPITDLAVRELLGIELLGELEGVNEATYDSITEVVTNL